MTADNRTSIKRRIHHWMIWSPWFPVGTAGLVMLIAAIILYWLAPPSGCTITVVVRG